jgi:hypothetical protein
MALVSPGIEVKIIDESQYASTAVGTVPMLVVASAQDKLDPTTGNTALGTTAANAEKTYLIGSQRELVSTFGEPSFYQNSTGTALHGYELNEYGLMAAYSLLGVSNRCYVVRADIDLAELDGSAGRPTSLPSNGTHWLDIANTRFGIFEWNASTQKFVNKIPTVLTEAADIDAGTAKPKPHIGKEGDYAIDATSTDNNIFRKSATGWFGLGTVGWYGSIPAVTGTVSSPTVSLGDSFSINGSTITLSSTTLTSVVSDINTAAITGITASQRDNKLQLHADSTAASGQLVIANVSGTFLTDVGLSAGTNYAPAVNVDPHTNVPEWKSGDTAPRPSASAWIKTTSPNNGQAIDMSVFSSITQKFGDLNVTGWRGERRAIFGLDPIGGGLNIAEGTVIAVTSQLSTTGQIIIEFNRRAVKGELVVTGETTTPTFTASDSFTINSSVKGSESLTATTIVLTGTTAESFVEDINSENITNVTAELEATGAITLKHSLGGYISLDNVSGTALTDAGFSNTNTYITTTPGGNLGLSNFVPLTYVASKLQPSTNPANSRLWYHNITDEVDIMIHDGTNWKGYRNVASDSRGYDLTATSPNGAIVGASAPLTQSDGTALVGGDIWIDTSDLENYPMIKRYEYNATDSIWEWIQLDNTDQTSEDGVLFADARYMGDGTTGVASGDITSIADLTTSNYLDLDAPAPALYPRGMILFNQRRSGYNVKRFTKDYFNAIDFSGETLPTEVDCWVSVAGLKNDGSPYMGRHAVRQTVIAAMKSVVDTSGELREEQRGFNLMSCPGYSELIANLIALNNDRRNTAFVVADAPFRLGANSTDIQNWALNVNLSTDNNDDGLVSADTYMGLFYPSGITTDLSGSSIMVPASHMILRTMIRSDDASYPWFAPAGVRRGVVDNGTGLVYLDKKTGEATSTGIRESLRDTLYSNSINPISFFPGNGILNYGNKSRTATASALDRINVARLTAYIRERLGVITKPFVFEPNDKLTRDEVKQVVESLMNDLVAKRGLYDYLVVCDESNNTNDRIDRNELYIDVAIEPVKAVEFIYIPVRIQNTGSI